MARILIVDDNASNLKLAARLLAHAGHVVVEAQNGPDALRLARESQPDLILMDIQMPGMDGMAALRGLRAGAGTAAIKVAALTAHAMKGDSEALLAAGFDAYLAKPYRRQELLAVVETVLGRANSIDARPDATGDGADENG